MMLISQKNGSYDMKLHISTLIIGAGYSGLILQHELKKRGTESVIIDKGYAHGFTGNDYIVFLKNKFDFTSDTINVVTSKISSGSGNFKQEYTKKVYNKKLPVNIFSGDDVVDNSTGYKIDPNILMENRNIYSNITVNGVDYKTKTVYGFITHINKKVEITYNVLINTLPIHKLAGYMGVNLFDKIGLFISYFPVGIKRSQAIEPSVDMRIEYYSDENIPFYRKQYHGNSIYYEYCLNKPFHEHFPYLISPGKFTKQTDSILAVAYEFFEAQNIFLVGRNACWNPDFLLDHIINNDAECDSGFKLHINNLYTKVMRND